MKQVNNALWVDRVPAEVVFCFQIGFLAFRKRAFHADVDHKLSASALLYFPVSSREGKVVRPLDATDESATTFLADPTEI